MRRVTCDAEGVGHCFNDQYDADDDSCIDVGGYGYSDGNGLGESNRYHYWVHGDGDHTYGDGHGDGGCEHD